MSEPTSQAPPGAPGVKVLGVRHHGPGSARALTRALDDYQPDCVLIEGPADADGLVEWVGAGLKPPVALLAWRTDDPSCASFWPLAVFSPEWQALAWAAQHGAQVHFMDLPARNVLAPDTDQQEDDDQQAADQDPGEADPEPPRTDPIARLADLAGYDDPEAWWEDAVELRQRGDPFEALAEAIGLLRQDTPETDHRTLVREAHMRKVLRAQRRHHERVAVVCGAWHAPALADPLPTVKADSALLSGLPKARTQLTWVPWTHRRLATATGYGAGVRSPGWYHHLFTAQDEPVVRWLTAVARTLRDHDLPASSAHIIEATRLAQALAALRGRPMPGLEEMNEATWSVLCEGSHLRADLVSRELVVGDALGTVPHGVPMVPLDADMRATARRLRLSFAAQTRSLVLDLRKPNDLARSHLLRRLRILGVNWGTPTAVSGTGTFKEGWELAWEPEMSVAVVEAAAWGTTVVSGAGNALAGRTGTLPEVTDAIEQALAADLGDVLEDLLAALDEQAAAENDVGHLLDAIPPLARTQRYGDVRATDTASLAQVTRAILARACASLPAAGAGTGKEAASALRSGIDSVQDVIALLGPEATERWNEALAATLDARGLAGQLAGRITRILLDTGALEANDAAARMSRALSPGSEAAEQAEWIEGFLAGSALLLMEDDRLLGILDAWVAGIDVRAFVDALPALRRAMGAWPPAARRNLARRIAQLGHQDAPGAAATDDSETAMLAFAAPALASVGLMLGAPSAHPGPDSPGAEAAS